MHNLNDSHADLLAEIERLRAHIATLEAVNEATTSAHITNVRMLLNTIHDAVVVFDADLHIFHWNPIAEKLYGWTAEEVIGKHINQVLSFRYVDHAGQHDAVEALLTSSSWRGEVIITRRDGSEIVVESSSNVFRNEHGDMLSIMTIIRDRTERTQLLAREQAAQAAAEAAQLRLQLLSSALHLFASSRLDLDAVLQRVVQHLAGIVGGSCVVHLLADNMQGLETKSFFYTNPETYTPLHSMMDRVAVERGLYEQVVRTRQLLAVSSHELIGGDSRIMSPTGEELPSCMLLIIPLISYGATLGTLTVLRDDATQPFTDSERTLLTDLGKHAAIAIDNAQLFESVRTMSQEKSEALTLLDTLFTSLPVGFAFLDRSLAFMHVNTNFAEFTGRSVAALMGHPLTVALSEHTIWLEPLCTQVLATGTTIHNQPFDAPTLQQPNILRNWLLNFSPIQSQEHGNIGIGIMVIDVTERTQVERELRASEAALRAILESTLQAYVLLDLDLRVVLWNDTAAKGVARQFGRQMMVGEPISTYMLPETISARTALMRQAASGEYVHTELNVGSPSAPRWLAVDYNPVRTADDQISGICICTLDVTNEHVASEKLRESETRFRLLAENARDMIYRYRLAPSYGFEYVSPAATALIGYTPDELYQTAALGSQFIYSDDPTLIDTTSMVPVAVPRTMSWVRKDGTVIWIEQHAQIITDEHGAPVAIEGIVRNVTARKQAADEIQNYTQQLQTLSRRLVEVQEAERRNIARELHDEFGQLLTVLTLLLEHRSAQADGDLHRRLEEAQALIHDLTERTRQMSLNLRPPMLDDFGLLVTLRWYVERYTAQSQIAVDFKHSGLEEPLPAQIIIAAFRIIQEALTNVARHAHTLNVSLRVWRNLRTLNIEIEDQGAGFALEQKLASGTNTGLLGMRERVLLLDGTIHILSEIGQGTRVLVEIPLDRTITEGAIP